MADNRYGVMAALQGISQGLIEGMKMRKQQQFQEEELALKKEELALRNEQATTTSAYKQEILQGQIDKMALQMQNTKLEGEKIELQKMKTGADIVSDKQKTVTTQAKTIADMGETVSKLTKERSRYQKKLNYAQTRQDPAAIEDAQNNLDQIEQQISDTNEAKDRVMKDRNHKLGKLTGKNLKSVSFQKAIKDMKIYKSNDDLYNYIDSVSGLNPGEEDELVDLAEKQIKAIGGM